MQKITSVCTYCGTGCDIVGTVENKTLVRIDAHPNGTVSRGKLCVKGKQGFDFLFSPRRINEPRISKKFIEKNRSQMPEWLAKKLFLLRDLDVDFYAVDQDIALDIAGWKTKEIIDKYGSRSIGCVGGARTSCENGYFFQKFAREIIGTPHVDNCGRVCHAPSLAGLKRTVGEGASSNPFDDILLSEFMLIIGSNTTEAHPIVSHRVMDAVRGGASLAVIDVRKTAIFKSAEFEMTIPFETNLLVINALAWVIISENLTDQEFVQNRTRDYEAYKTAVLADTQNNPEFFRSVAGYEHLADLIPAVARKIATKKTLFLWGLGVSEHIDGSDTVSAIAHLALITGNIGKRGAGLMPLRGQNNVQGACDMGCLPYYTAGYKTPKEIGKMTPQMFEAMISGEMKALFNMGEDLAHVHANLHKVDEALDQLEFLCVNELFPNEITKKADIIFGVKSAYEKEGIYINAERRLHLSKPLMESPLPDDWEIYAGIAERIGKPAHYKSHREIWQDLRAEAEYHFGGASYELLEADQEQGKQWPIGENDTPVLHLENFRTDDGLGHFVYRSWKKRGYLMDCHGDKSPQSGEFWLTTGRVIHHYNNAAQTKESIKLNSRYEEDIVLISLEDSKRFDMEARYTLISQHGKSRPLLIKADKGIAKGTLFVSFHHARSHINYLFGDEADEITMTPNFKALKVKLEQS